MRKSTGDDSGDEVREPFTIYAVRLEGESGWRVDIGAGNLWDISCRRQAEGQPAAKLVSIIQGWRPRHTHREKDRTHAWAAAISHNWVLDPVTGYWCSPADMLREPADNPPQVDTLEVGLHPPKEGVLGLRFHAEGIPACTGIYLDAVYDLFPRLLSWLEGIVTGKHPRVSLSDVDMHLVLTTFPAGEHKLRFSVLLLHTEAHWCFDVLVNKRELVGLFYRALRALVTDTPTFKREWLDYMDRGRGLPHHARPVSRWMFTEHFSLEDERMRQRPIESAVVEEFLRSERQD
jgi:hypothetical protein